MRITVMMRTRTTLVVMEEAAIRSQGGLRTLVGVALMDDVEPTTNRTLLVIPKLVFTSVGANFISCHVRIKTVCQIRVHFLNDWINS
jgi:hypothetical protein